MCDSTWRLGLSSLICLLGVGLYGCGQGSNTSSVTTTDEANATAQDGDDSSGEDTAAGNGDMTSADESSTTADTETTVPVRDAEKEDAEKEMEKEPADTTEPDTAAPVASSDDNVVEIKDEVVVLGTGDLLTGIPGDGDLTVEEIKAWLADETNHEPLQFELPFGLHKGAAQMSTFFDPSSLTRAKIELGRQLYFDKRLSADGTVSCADCHHPDEGYARHTQFGVGINDQKGGRNSPVSYNRILSAAQFWDGRAASLEEQAVGPIENPIEMGNTHEGCVDTLKGIEGYRLQFDKIFGGEMTIEQVGQAIAAFERCIVTGPTPFDYQEQLAAYEGIDPDDLKEDDPELYEIYQKAVADAEAHPMSDEAKHGMKLFFSDKVGCTACHVGPNLSDEKYHNLGIGMDKDEPDMGRHAVSKDEKDIGAFKTPTIRNVALTAPYMHDGSVATLEEVVEWYNKGGHANEHLSEKVKKLDLTDQDKKDLVAFMNACTGDFPPVEQGRLPQ